MVGGGGRLAGRRLLKQALDGLAREALLVGGRQLLILVGRDHRRLGRDVQLVRVQTLIEADRGQKRRFGRKFGRILRSLGARSTTKSRSRPPTLPTSTRELR